MNNAKLTSTPQSFDFDGWSALLGDKDALVIAPNTVLTRDLSGSVLITLHQTTIVTFCKSGPIVLDTGGWNTPLTRQRMNLVLPQNVRVRNRNGNLEVVMDRIVAPTQDNRTALIDLEKREVTV